MSLETLLYMVEPHPELVAIQRPTPLQVAEAAGVLGLLTDADSRWFRPAVAA